MEENFFSKVNAAYKKGIDRPQFKEAIGAISKIAEKAKTPEREISNDREL